MSTFQEIDPEEISSFVPQQEDLFWENKPLELNRLHFQIIDVKNRISVAMILDLFEYIKTSQITVDDTHIFRVAGASINVEEPRICYFLGVLAYKLRNFTKDRNLQAFCLYSLGSASTSLHKPKQALSVLLEAKQIFTELGNEEGYFLVTRS